MNLIIALMGCAPRGRPSATFFFMCVACAMAAAGAASGFRTWLQTHGFSWLTPKRLRALTVTAMCAAGIVSTVGVSGSTPPPGRAAHQAPTRSAP
jgi:hypothetical protein